MQLSDKGMLSKKTNKLSAKFTIPSQFALNNPQSATHLCALQIGCILRNQINDFCALLLLKKGCREVTHILAHVRVIWNIAAFCCLQFCRSLLLSVRVCNAWLNELFIFLPSSSLLIPFSPADGEVWVSACLTLCIWNLMLFFREFCQTQPPGLPSRWGYLSQALRDSCCSSQRNGCI